MVKRAFDYTGIKALVVGLGVVVFVDDYLGVRARRNLGLRKRGKTVGIVGFGRTGSGVARRPGCSAIHVQTSCVRLIGASR